MGRFALQLRVEIEDADAEDQVSDTAGSSQAAGMARAVENHREPIASRGGLDLLMRACVFAGFWL
jgi:hypothetical protein